MKKIKIDYVLKFSVYCAFIFTVNPHRLILKYVQLASRSNIRGQNKKGENVFNGPTFELHCI
jgi:hypothetical protein